jgi:hypothetical protein
MTRIQMPVDAQRTVEFLIRHESDLSDAAGQPGANDSATARLLAERVGTIERLKLLSVMTYAKLSDRSATTHADQGLERLWHICSITEHELTCELKPIESRKYRIYRQRSLSRDFRYISACPFLPNRRHLNSSNGPADWCGRKLGHWKGLSAHVVARDKPFLLRRSPGHFQFRPGYYKSRGLLERIGVLDIRFLDRKRVLRNPGSRPANDLIQRLALSKRTDTG